MNELRIVIDTNVVISGSFWKGISRHIIELIDGKNIVIIISNPIIEEYNEIIYSEDILERTKHFKEPRENIMMKLLQKSVVVSPNEEIKIIKDDPGDDKFIEAAIAGNARYIITKDYKHILPLKEFRGIKIVTPEEFLESIEKLGWLMLTEESLKKDWDNEEDDKWNKL